MLITTEGKKRSSELKKNIGLIHSTNKLSLLERKISNALLYNAYEQLLTKNEHVIHIKLLSDLVGFNSKNYKKVKHALMSLMSSVLEWNIIDSSKENAEPIWVASTFLSDAKIEGPICTYSYSNRMRELCYHPKFYGRINMDILTKFRSSYGLALYENCIRYQGVNSTPWLDLPVYRKLMGVENGSYSSFRFLLKSVINISVEEVNKFSSILVEPEIRKQGREVTSIRFHIKPKELNTLNVDKVEQEKIEDRSLISSLNTNYGLSKSKILDLVSQYGEAYLSEKIDVIESSASFKSGKIENLGRYLEKAIKENYQKPKSSKKILIKSQNNKEKKEKINRMNSISLSKYQGYQNEKFITLFKNLPENDGLKEKIEKEFEANIAKTFYHSSYAKGKFNDPLVIHRFGDFIREHYREFLNKTLSYEVFCDQNNIKIYTLDDDLN